MRLCISIFIFCLLLSLPPNTSSAPQKQSLIQVTPFEQKTKLLSPAHIKHLFNQHPLVELVTLHVALLLLTINLFYSSINQ